MAAGVKTFHQDIDLRGYIDLNGNEARNLRLQNLAADPGSPPGDGIIFYRTDTDKVRARINGGWVDLATMDDVTAAGISSTLVDAKGDLIVATGDNTVTRQAVGTNGHAFFANSAQATGVEWRAIAASDIASFAEEVSDQVGSMVSGNTESGITVVYQDGDNTLDFTVNATLGTHTTGTLPTTQGGTGRTDLPGSGAVVLAGPSGFDYDGGNVGEVLVGGGMALPSFATIDSTYISDFTTAARTAISVTDSATLDLSYSAGAISGTVLDSPTVAGATPAQLRDRSTHTGSQLFSTITTSNTDRLLGRDTAGGGAVEEITVGGGLSFTGSGGIQTAAFTGDVTKTAGGTALTIANDAVTNAKAANMAANTLKGNNTGSTADPADLTVAQVKTLLAYAAGDVAFTPAQGIAATTVQAAIEEAVTDLTAAITAATESKAWKDPVKAASVGANITLSGTQTIDGVALVAGDRVLIKDQTNHAQDGIYVVAAGAWSRAADANTAAEHTNATVLVLAGTQNAGDTYTQTATIAALGTTAQVWVKSGEGNTVYTASTGLELVGNAFRIATSAAGNGLTGGGGAALAVGAGTGITVGATTVGISNGGVTATQLATSVAGNGLTGGGGTALAVGAGTGISVGATTVSIDTSVVVRKATGTLTGGTNSEVLTHSLNTRNVKLTVRNNAAPYDEVEVANEATSVNTVTVYAGTGNNLPAGYTWTIIG